MGEGLILYDAARKALAAAVSTDEVAVIRDKAAQLRLYAQQAKDKGLEADAAEIRARAELRLGELMRAQRETVGVAKAGQPHQKKNKVKQPNPIGFQQNPIEIKPEQNPIPTLAEAGIGKKLADRARKAAAMPPEVFEETIKKLREKVIAPPRRFGRLPTPEEEIHGEKIIAKAEAWRWALPWLVFVGQANDDLAPWLASSPFVGKPVEHLERIKKEIVEVDAVLAKMKKEIGL